MMKTQLSTKNLTIPPTNSLNKETTIEELTEEELRSVVGGAKTPDCPGYINKHPLN